MAEQTQMNIKKSTKEGKIKVLVWLTNYFENKRSFREMTKQDILDYLNNLRSPVSERSNPQMDRLLQRKGR
jgi:hypothetical protein